MWTSYLGISHVPYGWKNSTGLLRAIEDLRRVASRQEHPSGRIHEETPSALLSEGLSDKTRASWRRGLREP